MRLTSSSSMTFGSGSMIWFRKGIRIHDNPALEYATRGCSNLYPLFVIDPHYMKPDPNTFSPGSSRAGLNRISFLLESLSDLDVNLKKIGSRLLVLKGDPSEVLIRCLKEVSKVNLNVFFVTIVVVALWKLIVLSVCLDGIFIKTDFWIK